MAHDTLEETRLAAPPALVTAVEGTLADFLAARIAELDAVDPALGGFARTARDLVMAGGKRLRPLFAYWGWQGVTGPGERPEPLLPALGALELMHTFALVHDDVMDESATRRGRPTAHRVFGARHGSRFGTSAAILVGDLCLVWADQLLARTPLAPATLLAVRAGYDRMRIEAVAGQYLDVLGEAEPSAWSVERALLVARLKTAGYTVQRPLEFGLALAGPEAAPEATDAYQRYGAAVGVAFQLRDDLLGVYGDPEITGKPAADDLRTGKPTTLLMLAQRLAGAHTDLAGAVIPADGSGEPASGDIARLARAVAETGAPELVEEMIDELVSEGVAALADAPIRPDARAALVTLATTATHRRA